jgi:hypothetical protein
MLNKITTSTGLLMIGLTSLSSASSTQTIDELHLIHSNLYAKELNYNCPESVETPRIDSYVDSAYKMDYNLSNKYNLVDDAFMNIVQKFSMEQVELDQEFSQALDELFLSKVNAKPTKKRF